MIKQRETFNTWQEGHAIERVVSIIFGVIEIALLFRLFFKLLGANPENGFVQGLYSVTQPIVGIFVGIFSGSTTKGAETTAVFEPATLIAMVVVAVVAWAVMKIITPRLGKHEERTEYTKNVQ